MCDPAGENARLELPPILEGYHGAPPYRSDAGGVVDPTLLDYIKGKPFVDSRGSWYDITTWAARTHHCDAHPESVACMACAMNMPLFTKPAGVVPIGALCSCCSSQVCTKFPRHSQTVSWVATPRWQGHRCVRAKGQGRSFMVAAVPS